jgi:hypothetical protein
MSETLNPYSVLGIPRGASDRQVRSAYRRLAKRYHPDLHSDVGASEQMRRVNQAWELLSTPASRASDDTASALVRSPSYGHWAAPRRSAPMARTSTQWNGSWASPPPAAGIYPGTSNRPYGAGEGPSWPGIVISIVIGAVVVVALFAGVLPFPLVGIALLVIIRGIFSRFEE